MLRSINWNILFSDFIALIEAKLCDFALFIYLSQNWLVAKVKAKQCENVFDILLGTSPSATIHNINITIVFTIDIRREIKY